MKSNKQMYKVGNFEVPNDLDEWDYDDKSRVVVWGLKWRGRAVLLGALVCILAIALILKTI